MAAISSDRARVDNEGDGLRIRQMVLEEAT